MKLFEVLLKKELSYRFGGMKSGAKDTVGFILSAIISLVFLTLFVFLFVEFQSKFTPLNLENEVLVLFLAAAILLQIVFALPKTSIALYGGADAEVILPLPISERALLLSKFAAIFIGETVNSLFLQLPLIIAFGVVKGAGALYILPAAAAIFLSSLTVVAVSAALSPIYLPAKRFLTSRPIAFTAASLAFLSVLFALYSRILAVLSEMLTGNRLKYIFNKSTAEVIRRIARFSVYAKQTGDFLNGDFLAFVIVIFSAAALFAAAYFITRGCYIRFLRSGVSREKNPASAGKNKIRGVTGSLVVKELREIFSDPAYLFSYASVLLTLPLYCDLTLGVLDQLIIKLVGEGGDFTVPFAVLITVMYSCVCNTAAGDVISREGRGIAAMKTVPVPYSRQIACKAAVALAVAAVSDVFTVFVLVLRGRLSVLHGLMIFAIAFSATAASVLNLLSRDIDSPAARVG
ncbi:MAG: hypothetical protein J6U35_02015, partial [Clostridia bacterium]|nr:hypothetical protein [Clostridia bacterium]